MAKGSKRPTKDSARRKARNAAKAPTRLQRAMRLPAASRGVAAGAVQNPAAVDENASVVAKPGGGGAAGEASGSAGASGGTSKEQKDPVDRPPQSAPSVPVRPLQGTEPAPPAGSRSDSAVQRVAPAPAQEEGAAHPSSAQPRGAQSLRGAASRGTDTPAGVQAAESPTEMPAASRQGEAAGGPVVSPPAAAPATKAKEAAEDLVPTRPAPTLETLGEPAATEAKARTRQWEPAAEALIEPEAAATEAQFEAEPEPAQLVREQAPAARTMPSMFIVQVTPELAPVAKVGGLADVVFGLSRELELRGNHVETVLPKYDCLRYDHIWGLTPCYNDLWVPWYGGSIHCTVFFGFVHGRKCFFIEPHSRDNFFNRGSIYGFHDDLMRFAFFSRAAMEFLWKSGKHPEIIHCHDWQTALVPVFLYEIYQRLGMTHPRVCFTIHNFQHQGRAGSELLRATGLHRPEYFIQHDRLGDNHHPRDINLMKGGIVYSNFVTTVSPRHAGEAKDHGQGFGLDPTLRTHHVKYGGVINGIDYDAWNPETDAYIPVHYNVETLDAKYDNKRALRRRLLLADNEKPIVAFIGRLDPQKGLDLVRHGIFYTLARAAQFVLLGSSPDGRINNEFWGLKRQLNDDPNCHLEVRYDEELAHLIYAGADMVLVPSRFEPCGLTQMIAMRYGTIPIVREVGGLADTVFDKDYSHRPLHERNGYVFRDYDNRGLESALGRAISCYYSHYPDFRELMKHAMRYDYSWNYPGQHYVNIYDYIRAK